MKDQPRATEKDLLALAASAFGRAGGSAGVGKSKKRGTAEYYAEIARKSHEVRRKKAQARKTP